MEGGRDWRRELIRGSTLSAKEAKKGSKTSSRSWRSEWRGRRVSATFNQIDVPSGRCLNLGADFECFLAQKNTAVLMVLVALSGNEAWKLTRRGKNPWWRWRLASSSRTGGVVRIRKDVKNDGRFDKNNVEARNRSGEREKINRTVDRYVVANTVARRWNVKRLGRHYHLAAILFPMSAEGL